MALSDLQLTGNKVELSGKRRTYTYDTERLTCQHVQLTKLVLCALHNVTNGDFDANIPGAMYIDIHGVHQLQHGTITYGSCMQRTLF